MPLRFDIAKLEKPTIDHNGYLTADAVITRAGVFEYRRPDGSKTRELRSPEDVFNQDSLATLKHRPFTDGHPIVGRVTADNTRQLSRGMVISEPKRDGNLVRAKVIVTDQKAIDKIMRKKDPIREVSAGYDVDLIQDAGEFEGERYDHKQTNIVYNHVALVKRGRAGPEARLRIDADDAAVEDIAIELRSDVEETEENIHVPGRDSGDFQDGSFRTIKVKGIDGVQMVVGRLKNPPEGQRGSAVAQKFIFDKSKGWTTEKAKKWVSSHKDHKEDQVMIKIKRDAIATATFKQDAFVVTVNDEEGEEAVKPAMLALDAAITHIKELESQISTQKGRIDELVEKSELPPERLDELGQERAEILGVAHYVGLSNVDTLRNDEIKKLVVHRANPKLNLEEPGVDQAYINGRYDSVCDNIRKNNKAIKSLAQLRQIARADDYLEDEEDERSPRQTFVEDTQNMWMSDEDKKQLAN